MSIYQPGPSDNLYDVGMEIDVDDLYLEYDDIEEALEDLQEFEDIQPFDNRTSILADIDTYEDVTLTMQQMDTLASKLGPSWKRFARMTSVLSEGDIFDIECSCHTMYERGYQTIILWEQKSKDAIRVSMVANILVAIQRNDIVRDIIGEELVSLQQSNTPTNHLINCLCNELQWNWKEYARQTGFFSELEITNIDEEEHNIYEKFHKMLMLWQEKSISPVTFEDMKTVLVKMKKGVDEKVIRYTIDNGNDIRKIRIRSHHALKDLNEELMRLDKNLQLVKVQYIDPYNGHVTITCDNEAQLDLAIFDEHVLDFNVVTKRRWWVLFSSQHHVRSSL